MLVVNKVDGSRTSTASIPPPASRVRTSRETSRPWRPCRTRWRAGGSPSECATIRSSPCRSGRTRAMRHDHLPQQGYRRLVRPPHRRPGLCFGVFGRRDRQERGFLGHRRRHVDLPLLRPGQPQDRRLALRASGPGFRSAVDHGLFGMLTVEPKGSSYLNANTGNPLLSGGKPHRPRGRRSVPRGHPHAPRGRQRQRADLRPTGKAVPRSTRRPAATVPASSR